MSVVDQQLYQQQKCLCQVPLQEKTKKRHCDILTFAFCRFPVIWWNQRYYSVSLSTSSACCRECISQSGTWHCKITVPIYFYSVALLLAMLAQWPGKVCLPYFQENIYTPLWRQPAFILLSTFLVILPAKPQKCSKIWKCCLRYCATKYAEYCGYFCYFQLKSDNQIDTTSATCLSISHVQFMMFHSLCNGNEVSALGSPFSFLHPHTSWLAGCTDL